VIDYEGRFLNGKFFDSTVKRHESFYYVYGTEWQVVKGLEQGVGLMTEGEKAYFIYVPIWPLVLKVLQQELFHLILR